MRRHKPADGRTQNINNGSQQRQAEVGFGILLAADPGRRVEPGANVQALMVDDRPRSLIGRFPVQPGKTTIVEQQQHAQRGREQPDGHPAFRCLRRGGD
jgi:hypothetical protein